MKSITLAALKRPRCFIPLSLFLILIVVLGILFHPSIQKKFLLAQLTPLTDELHIAQVHLTPWSLTLEDARVRYQGGDFRLKSALVRFCLSALIRKTVSLHKVSVDQLSVDLTHFKPDEKPKSDTPFRGVLASLNTGFRIAIRELAANGQVTTKPGETILAKLDGGIKADAVGGFHVALDLQRQNQHASLHGMVYLKQSPKRGFQAIATDLQAHIKAKALPLEEKARIAVSVKEGVLSNTARSGEHAISPEAITIGIYLDPEKPRSVLGFAGVYDGNVGLLRGAYRISANQSLVRPYLKGQPVPNMIDTLAGQVRLDITKRIGDVTVNNDLTLTNLRKFSGEPSMPRTLSVLSDLSLALEADALRLSRFDTQVMDDGGKRYLSATLPSAVRLGLEDPMRFLETNKPLFLLRLEGIPASWAAPLIPDYTISGGLLHGEFKLVAAKADTLRVLPMKPLSLKGVRVSQGEQLIAEQLGLTMRPQVSYKKESVLEIAIEDFVVEERAGRVASTTLRARIPNAGKGDPDVHVDAKAEVDLSQLATLPALRAGSEKLPSELSFAFQGKVAKSTQTIEIQELIGGLSQGAGKRFLSIDLARPLSIPLKREKGRLKNPQGTLATVSIDKLDLAWLSPFVPDAELSGEITRAQFELSSDGKDEFVLTPRFPLEIAGLSVTSEREAFFDNLSVKLSPTFKYSPERMQIDYQNLGISANNKPLIAANGTLFLPSSQPANVKASGDTEIHLQALAGQPLVQRLLGAPITASARINADYRLAQANRALDIERLRLKLSQEDSSAPAIEVQSNGKIRVPTALRPGEPLALGMRGGINLIIRNWKPTPFEQVLREKNISFSQISGHATLASDGNALSLDTKEPFVIRDLQVTNKNGDLLHPLTLGLKGAMAISDRDLRANVDDVTIDFIEQNQGRAVRANIAFELDREEERFKQLSAKLFAFLPEWLDQPAVLPGHSLVDGALESAFEIDPLGKIKWNTAIRNLNGGKELPLQTITLTGSGVLMRDGGFSLQMPLATEGKSGKSDAVLTANYSTQSEQGLLQLGITGRQFYLNDILATLDKIRTPPAAKEEKKPKEHLPEAEETVLSQAPDARAFWDRLPHQSQLELRLNQLFYTDYLVLERIRGGFDLTQKRLGVRDFAAYFHQSPMTLNGGIDFISQSDNPYDLQLHGAIKEFDLNKFFTELIPESKPRVEGLFGVTFDLAAQSPNLDQFRNHLDLDIKLNSRDGVFRPLPPDNVLLTGATPVLGVIGEGLSFVPTIGLGAGVVPRLVSYIKEIDYDAIDIHITGGGPKGLTIKQFMVNSPDILITAEGGIEYRAGVDILNRPLSLSAEMNMRGRGAAILHTLDLLKPEQDKLGYWKGPEFRIWGTPRKPKSNFNEIIQKAGRETLTGGITRPLSGIIGNIKYRW